MFYILESISLYSEVKYCGRARVVDTSVTVLRRILTSVWIRLVIVSICLERDPSAFKYAVGNRIDIEEVEELIIGPSEYADNNKDCGEHYELVFSHKDAFSSYVLERHEKTEIYNFYYLRNCYADQLFLVASASDFAEFGISNAWLGGEGEILQDKLEYELSDEAEMFDDRQNTYEYDIRDAKERYILEQRRQYEEQDEDSEGLYISIRTKSEGLTHRLRHEKEVGKLAVFRSDAKIRRRNERRIDEFQLHGDKVDWLTVESGNRFVVPIFRLDVNYRATYSKQLLQNEEKNKILKNTAFLVNADHKKVNLNLQLDFNSDAAVVESYRTFSVPFRNKRRWIRCFGSRFGISLITLIIRIFFGSLISGVLLFEIDVSAVFFIGQFLIFDRYKYIWRFESEADLSELEWENLEEEDSGVSEQFDDMKKYITEINFEVTRDNSNDIFKKTILRSLGKGGVDDIIFEFLPAGLKFKILINSHYGLLVNEKRRKMSFREFGKLLFERKRKTELVQRNRIPVIRKELADKYDPLYLTEEEIKEFFLPKRLLFTFRRYREKRIMVKEWIYKCELDILEKKSILRANKDNKDD
jgi:hypothetical protein